MFWTCISQPDYFLLYRKERGCRVCVAWYSYPRRYDVVVVDADVGQGGVEKIIFSGTGYADLSDASEAASSVISKYRSAA